MRKSASMSIRISTRLRCAIAFACMMLPGASYGARSGANVLHPALVSGRHAVQQTFPAPPADRNFIYWRAETADALKPLPLEAGTTNLHPEIPAGSDKMGRVELKGETAPVVITNSGPHFFLFVPDVTGVHPPLLVRMTPRRGVRQVTAMAQRGQRGFAILSEEIVKPYYRVLRRDGGTIYMEVWSREPLQPGEYAFIGSDIALIATFRISQ